MKHECGNGVPQARGLGRKAGKQLGPDPKGPFVKSGYREFGFYVGMAGKSVHAFLRVDDNQRLQLCKHL